MPFVRPTTFLAGSLAAVLSSVNVHAQSVSTGEGGEVSAGLEEVLVTARRRSESLQDVPVSVAALNAEALQMRSVFSEGDLQAAFPGLVVRSANNNNQLNYVIRGESVDAYSGSPPGVQPYINDVPYQVSAATTFYDLENIQVLKGPQGTLFGRNSTGGAVLFKTQEPTEEFGGYASVQYGNLDRFMGEAALNIPVSDTVKMRIAGTATSGGAWVKNLYDNKKLGDRDENSARFSLSFQPSEALRNLTTVQISDSEGTNAPNTMYYTIPCGEESGFNSCLYSPDVPAFQDLINGDALEGYPTGYVYPGGFEDLPEFLRSKGDYVVNANAPFNQESSSELVINQTELEISESLSIKNIFGYSHSENAINYDTDYSPYPIVQQYPTSAPLEGGNLPVETGEWENWSNEFQLLGTAFNDDLDYLLGFFYIDTEEDYYSPLTIFGITPPDTVTPPFSVAYNAVTGNESYAVFAQGTYRLTDKLNLTLGGRYTWEEVTMTQGPESIFAQTIDPAPFSGADLPQEVEESDPSWIVSLDYHVNDDMMVYAATRGSWRRGGFNPFNPPTPSPMTAAAGDGGNYFLPEKIQDVEAGIKYDALVGGVPIRANLAVYHSWVEDIQKTAYVVIDGTVSSSTINVPETEIKGFEADIAIEPLHWLGLGASVALTDAEFTDPESQLFGSSVTYGPFGDAPEWSGTLYADASMDMGALGALNYHVDVFAQTHFYFSNLGGTIQPGTKLPGYTLVNMRLDWNNMFGSAVKASAFVKNLTDELYYTGGSAGAQNYSVESATFGLPRTYGVQLRVDF